MCHSNSHRTCARVCHSGSHWTCTTVCMQRFSFYDTFGDHFQTSQTNSEDSQVHDWVVYKLGTIRSLFGPLQKPQAQDNCLPPPRTLIMDFTMTHVRFGRSHLYPMGQVIHTSSTRSSDGDPDPDGSDPDGSLKEAVRIKIRHYHNVYLNRPDPIAFLPLMNCRRNRISFVSFELRISLV